MNNTFDWNRFCKVLHKDLHTMWNNFGRTMLVLAILPFAAWLFMVVFIRGESMPADIRVILINSVAALAALMTPSRMYRTWNLQVEGIHFAMLPASKLEKFLSALLYTLIICPLCVLLGSIVLDLILTVLPFGPYRSWLWEGMLGILPTPNFCSIVNIDGTDFYNSLGTRVNTLFTITYLLGFIASTLLFFFTSTLFKRHKVLSTFLWLYLIEFVLSLTLIPASIHLFDNTDITAWMDFLSDNLSETAAVNWAFGLAIAFNTIVSAVLTCLSWHRLKKMAY